MGRNPEASFYWFDLECFCICGEGKVENKRDFSLLNVSFSTTCSLHVKISLHGCFF